MPKLTYKCPVCQKPLVLEKETTFGENKLFSYTCGHTFASEQEIIDTNQLDFMSVDDSGKKARGYQELGIKAILESNFNLIIGDQMRLGKTAQALLALKNAYKDRTPCLILVKGANLWQWIREYKIWTDTLPNGIFPIIGSNAWIPPGFSSYIMSMDTFSKPKIQEALKKISFKLIIVDEAHSFKNTESNRSKALVNFVAFLNTGSLEKSLNFTCTRCGETWIESAKQSFDKRIGHTVLSKSSKCPKCGQYCFQQLLSLGSDQSTTQSERDLALTKLKELEPDYKESEPETDYQPCGLILLTGTPILNRAEEYFVPLNLVAPEKFSSLERFKNHWLDPSSKGGRARIKPYYLQSFKEQIKPYLLRREKEDVYTDMPKINRIFKLVEPDASDFGKRYNFILDKLKIKLADKPSLTFFESIAELTELRMICGMMKLMWTVDYLSEDMEERSSGNGAVQVSEKVAIGIHHESVRDTLYLKLGLDKNCLKLSGEDNAERKDWVMRNWEHSIQQFLIINMLAGGVGMDFHYCDNVIILERQWNHEIESQFEFRFYNPDLSIKKNPTTIEYIIAKGTLDQWWYDMVEEKKQNVGEVMYNNWSIEHDQDSFTQLLERTIQNRV